MHRPSSFQRTFLDGRIFRIETYHGQLHCLVHVSPSSFPNSGQDRFRRDGHQRSPGSTIPSSRLKNVQRSPILPNIARNMSSREAAGRSRILFPPDRIAISWQTDELFLDMYQRIYVRELETRMSVSSAPNLPRLIVHLDLSTSPGRASES